MNYDAGYYYKLSHQALCNLIKMSLTFNSCKIKVMNTLMCQ